MTIDKVIESLPLRERFYLSDKYEQSNLSDDMKKIYEKISNYDYGLDDRAFPLELYGALLLDAIFQVLGVHLDIKELKDSFAFLNKETAIYWNNFSNKLKLPDYIKNDPKSKILFNPTDPFKIEDFLDIKYLNGHQFESRRKRKTQKSNALKNHIKNITSILNTVDDSLLSESDLHIIKKLFLLYEINFSYKPLNMMYLDSLIIYHEIYPYTFFDLYSKYHYKNDIDISEFDDDSDFLEDFIYFMRTKIFDFLMEQDISLKDEDFWISTVSNPAINTFIKSECLHQVIHSVFIQYKDKYFDDNLAYLNKIKSINGRFFPKENSSEPTNLDSYIDLLVSEDINDISTFEIDNPFQNFNFIESDADNMTIDEEYGCPLKLFSLNIINFIIQINYAIQNSYLNPKDDVIFKIILGFFEDFVYCSEDSYSNFPISIEEIALASSKDLINKLNKDTFLNDTFFEFLKKVKFKESDDENSEEYKSYLEYLREKIESLQNEPLIEKEKVTKYVKIFESLCCVNPKKNHDKYFSTLECRRIKNAKEICRKRLAKRLNSAISKKIMKSF